MSKRYGLQLKDVERWYNSTEWAIHGWVSDKVMKSVIYHLETADIIEKQTVQPDLIWKRNKTMDA